MRRDVRTMHAAILAILVGFAGTALQSQSALSQEYSVVAPAFPSMPVDTAMARALFERFRGLDGEWEGRSTRGWEDSMSWRTIAGGSVAMQTSFEAHPGETMVTMISLDSGRLALTHYCVAGNQPRMIATACSPDGREVDFTFRDGGNLASRDLGHMDRAIFRFHEDGTMTSRWTWYQKGKERWMEEISYRRMR